MQGERLLLQVHVQPGASRRKRIAIESPAHGPEVLWKG